MSGLRILKSKPLKDHETHGMIRQRFEAFRRLLVSNNKVLSLIGDLEEKAQGEYLFDINYIRHSLDAIKTETEEIIREMIFLGGESYYPLIEKYEQITDSIELMLPGKHTLEEDSYILSLDKVDHHSYNTVGSKNAQLGELKGPLGMPVPAGFAITAWAYHHFMHSGDLQSRITERLDGLDIRNYGDLTEVSEDIREMVRKTDVPEDLSKTLKNEYSKLVKSTGVSHVALRSSAIGEDTLFSFAGQYKSFLNVHVDDLVETYREVIAGKFTPKAIYYFLSHSLAEVDQPMAVSCLTMVDAVAAGVVYTHNPVNSARNVLLVHSVFGLGKLLVDGVITPDLFVVSGETKEILERHIVDKPVQSLMNESGGTTRSWIPEELRKEPSISDEVVNKLVEYALKIEEHYGSPQDIEWALDKSGALFLLQTRPLQIIECCPPSSDLDLDGYEILRKGGTTVCPGGGWGELYHVSRSRDLENVPDGAILAAPKPFAGIVTALNRINGLITEVGSVASHMATLARETRTPTIVGVENLDELPAGEIVTLDATNGLLLQGRHEEVIATSEPDNQLLEDTAIYYILKQLLEKISPLNLLDPGDDELFAIDACITLHDITRFCHQKSIEEIFHGLRAVENKEQMAYSLKSEIPLEVLLIYLDKDQQPTSSVEYITEEELHSEPMKAVWEGILREGWPKHAPAPDINRYIPAVASHVAKRKESLLTEASYAFITGDYMLLSLRMGYHFTTIEALCSDEPSNNYIRYEHKGGGASIDRRIRRIRLIKNLLSPLGFEPTFKGDFLETMLSYEKKEVILQRLRILGRIAMMTKQLDMAMANDTLMQWYAKDFMKRLEIEPET